ncbi:MAG: hypothetical protein LC808_23880 [Actinobacteria bacterium]|nr:hypothetical protein [Actinomycetota bacterium]
MKLFAIAAGFGLGFSGWRQVPLEVWYRPWILWVALAVVAAGAFLIGCAVGAFFGDLGKVSASATAVAVSSSTSEATAQQLVVVQVGESSEGERAGGRRPQSARFATAEEAQEALAARSGARGAKVLDSGGESREDAAVLGADGVRSSFPH